MIPVDTPEWLFARIGCLTGSRFADAVRRTKTGWAASRENLLFDLLAERLTGFAKDHFVTEAMQWGLDNEKPACDLYEARSGILLQPAGFFPHPTIQFFGATPDRMIGTDGLLECKCPTTKTHLQYVIGGKVPAEYEPQMLAEMACSGRQWGEFISYDPRIPGDKQLFVVRFEPAPAKIKEAEEMAIEFLNELDRMFKTFTEQAA
jgi:putative phage-type endonuclease